MPASEVKSRYYQYLLGLIEDTSSPTAPMLNRIEQAIPDRESFERYVGVLMDKVEETQNPSPPMLDRISMLLRRLPDDD